MAIKAQALSAVFIARISGLDLRAPVGATLVTAIDNAINRHGVRAWTDPRPSPPHNPPAPIRPKEATHIAENPRWKRRPEGSTWVDFDPEDQLGRLNLVTAAKRPAGDH